jgi:hypothetical protein
MLRATSLKLLCENEQDAVIMAYGYGVMGTIVALQVLEPDGTLARLFCFPERFSDEQVVGVICQHVDGSPQSLNNSAASVIMVAFGRAWPCQ